MKRLLRTLSRCLLTLGLLTLATGCTSTPPGPRDLTSPYGRSHPLTAKIWDRRAARFISPQELASALARYDFILLGERHDNPDHHKLQAWLVQALADHNRRPTVAFEMIGSDKAGALKLYQQSDRHNADGLDAFVDWRDSGWPDWAVYKPIADAALFNGMKLTTANLPRAVVADMIKKGRPALPRALSQHLNLPDTIPEGIKNAMAADVRDAHCNSLPENLILPFVDIQFIRDAVMAQSLKESDTGAGGVLIAGAGHVRNDRGVPWHLAGITPKKTVVSVAFIEVEDGKTSPPSYAADWNAASLPFDYVWFTARATRDDPCTVFRKKQNKFPGKN